MADIYYIYTICVSNEYICHICHILSHVPAMLYESSTLYACTCICRIHVYAINMFTSYYIHESAMYMHEYMYIPYICPIYTYTYLIYAL